MASSNRHWPSMYRSSLACNIQQPQPDMNNGAGGKSSLLSSRCEEARNPEPRPRWNPRPEQIGILEAIFNSGMVNPPRDEIRRIRLQLQEHGPVGDANVFYWFQNRKSRTKHKLRAAGKLQPSGRAALVRASLQSPLPAHTPVTQPRHHLIPASTPVAPDTSSSSSDRSTGSSSKSVVKPAAVALASSQASFLPATAMDFLTPPPALAARQPYHHGQIVAPATVPTTPELMTTSPDSLLLQWQQQSPYMSAADLGAQYAHHSPVTPNVLLGLCNEAAALGQDCMRINSSNSRGLVGQGQRYWNNGGAEVCAKTDDAVSAVIRDDEKARLGSLHYDFCVNTTTAAPPVHAAAADAACTAAPSAGLLPSAATEINVAAATATSALLTDQLQGLLDFGLVGRTAPTATLVAVAPDAVTCRGTTMQFSVPAMRLDVKQFGEAAVLLRHPGEPVLLDESGVTIEPLQQDALYYVLVTGDLLNTAE